MNDGKGEIMAKYALKKQWDADQKKNIWKAFRLSKVGHIDEYICCSHISMEDCEETLRLTLENEGSQTVKELEI